MEYSFYPHKGDRCPVIRDYHSIHTLVTSNSHLGEIFRSSACGYPYVIGLACFLV